MFLHFRLTAQAPGFVIYGQYCANLAYAKYVLERQKKNEPRFMDFLEVSVTASQHHCVILLIDRSAIILRTHILLSDIHIFIHVNT